MPTYEYAYTNSLGQRKVIEDRQKFSDMKMYLHVVDPDDGLHYMADRIISRTANMKLNWDSYDDGQLPPVNAPTSVWD